MIGEIPTTPECEGRGGETQSRSKTLGKGLRARMREKGNLRGLKVAPQIDLRETDRKLKSDYEHEKEPCAQSRRPVMLG